MFVILNVTADSLMDIQMVKTFILEHDPCLICLHQTKPGRTLLLKTVTQEMRFWSP